MQLLEVISQNLLSFIVIMSVIVFIHEYGHFLVARICGVKVEEFSIGFGKKLFGFFDKKGTQWKFCLLPFGGYVKMFGDRNASSAPDKEKISKMTKEEKEQSFIFKNVYQRMAIVLAGPIANFIFAIFIFTFLFSKNGYQITLPIIHEVIEDSAAKKAGLKSGDEILEINNKEIKDFNKIREIVANPEASDELNFIIKRSGQVQELKVFPKVKIRKDFFGDEVKMKTIGITANQFEKIELNIFQSFGKGMSETYNITISIFKALGQLVTGKRSITELGGPVKIAKYSSKSVEMGIYVVIWFMALISINLGVMNLLPIPALDGGHFFYYLIEAAKGSPLSPKTQEFGYRIGISMILSLLIFTTINDVVGLFG